jgi:hypothetical protein
MRWTPLPFVGGAYADDATPWATQSYINYIPVKAEREGTRSPIMPRQAPGCSLFSADGVESAGRGMHNAEGLLVVVKGQTLYSVAADGGMTSLGTIPGVGRCSIAHNQITDGNQIAVANGLSGYVYNTVTDSLAQITDDGFPGAKVFDFVDQYIVGVEPQGRYWFWSDLAAAGDYNTLDRAEAETAPDKIVTLITTHGEVFVLGERTSEFFYNTGAATGTFQRRDAGMEIGCAAAHSVVRLDNSVVWLGHDGSVYRLNGYTPQRISTHPIEQAIARCNMADAYAYTFEDRGHKIYYLTFTDGQTFGFDMATGEWHRRKSYGLDFWRMSHLVRWSGAWMGLDYTDGSLYQLDWRLSNDAGQPLERIGTLPPIHDNGNRLIVNALKLELDTGITADSSPFPAPLNAPLTLTGSLADAYVDDSGTYSYVGTGGLHPHTYSLVSGALPTGATLGTDGTVTFGYTLAGTYNFTVRVTDAGGDYVDLADTVVISARPMLLAAGSGASVVMIQSTDGITWNTAPVITAGNANNAPYLTGLSGRYFGRGVAAAAKAAYSTNYGAAWSLTAANVTAGAVASGGFDAYTNSALILPAHTGNLQKSTDEGLTFTAGGAAIKYIVALNRTAGKLAGIDGNNVRLSTDTAATWTAGTLHGIQTVLCGMTDGTDYYFGGATLTPLPVLKKVTQAGVVSTVTLPTLTSATQITACAYGNGIKVIGTNNGLVAYDSGSGFVNAGVALTQQVVQIFWTGSHFILLTSSGGVGKLYTSTNGQSWTQRSTFAAYYPMYSVGQARA